MPVIEILGHTFRCAADTRGADRFVRFLRAALALIKIRFGGRVFLAEVIVDEFQRIGLRLAGDVDRVGTHVGNETDRAFRADVHAFIKLLRDAHRLVGRHPEAARCGLLERTGNERRRGIPFPCLLIELGDNPLGGLQLIKDRVRQRLAANPELFPFDFVQLGQE